MKLRWMLKAATAALLISPTAIIAQTQGRIAPLAYASRTLPNGLKVYSMRDPKSANVSVQVWYEVGSRDDPSGRSGFAHLFEHLMFKATRNLVPEQFDRLTEDVGGFNNASTNDDYTNYYEVVPANHLQRLLWAEADRMRSLVIEPGFFASERDVVKEELRSRVLASPYGRLLYLYFPQISYDVDPYARPGIGSIEDLDAATIDDVRAFHATYYRPDNAVLVIAGNFDQAQVDRWIETYFGSIEKPAIPIPQVKAVEPRRQEATHYTVEEPNTPLPAVLISYPAPPSSDRDTAALEVLTGILSTGESSRLHQSLVYRAQVASKASAFLDSKKGRGNLAVYAILSGGKSAEAGEAALRREISRLRDEPVTAAELAEAKNELLTDALHERETVDGKAGALARAVVLDGDPAAADGRLGQIAAVTAADIQRVARLWLTEAQSASIRYLPETKQGSPQDDRIETAPTVQTMALVAPPNIKIWQSAPEGERIAPPAPGPEIMVKVPRPSMQKLANGMNVITIEDHDLPLVTATLVARGGSADDVKAGAAQLAASVMTEGTTTRSATQIDADVEALGASLDGGANWDGSRIGMTVGTAELDKATEILADIARNATLPEEEIARQRTVAIDRVSVALGNPGAIAQMAAMRAVYGTQPYGHPANGTAASLKAIGRSDIESAYRSQWNPANVTFVLSGDVKPAQAKALAERYFAQWTFPLPPADRIASSARGKLDGKLVVIDMPKSGQAAVAVARKAVNRRDPDFYRTLVANSILGGGYSARLNQEIRIKRGLSYGSSSVLDARLEPGPFVAVTQTRNDAADQVLALTLGEMRRLASEQVSQADLAARRATLTGGFGRKIETTEGTADIVADAVESGIEAGVIARYLPSLLAVTPADVEAAASANLADKGATMIVVGEASQFVDKLRRTYPDLAVIQLGDLNLDSETLRR